MFGLYCRPHLCISYPALLYITIAMAATPPDAMAVEATAELAIHRDIEFAKPDGHSLKLDLYIPTGEKKPPLVVWIHGGSWRAGSKKNPPIAAVVEHGFALASISYRFSDKAIFPAQIHDCKAAVRWLRKYAGEYGYNAEWIGVAGDSAGGHLALLAGVTAGVEELEGTVGDCVRQSSAVQAIVDYYGPSDFVLRGQTQPDRAYTDKSGSFALLGGIPDTKKLDAKMEAFASPSSYVTKDDPPLIALHGDADNIVLLDQSQRIIQLYKDMGLDAQLITVKGSGHGGKKFFGGSHFDAVVGFLRARVSK